MSASIDTSVEASVEVPSARLRQAMAEVSARMEDVLGLILPPISEPEAPLFEAMRYASLNGGKRLRPLLVMMSAALFNVNSDCAERVAAAVEMVHCYSLVHDDLPAMDNDDLRRGRPTCHKAFDEATAILAGDGLLTRAFEVLAAPETHEDPAVRAALVLELAQAAGPHGMVGGQMVDLLHEGRLASAAQDGPLVPSVAAITRMHQLKTGRMIAVSCLAGAVLGKAPAHLRHALLSYAHDLGLCFQIVDDILDVEGAPEETGKSQGKDAAAGKSTFVTLLGLEAARRQAQTLAEQAVLHLAPFGAAPAALVLADVAGYVLARRS